MATLELSTQAEGVTGRAQAQALGLLFWSRSSGCSFVLALAIFAPCCRCTDPTDMDMLDVARVLRGAWLGADGLGRDELSRLIYGAPFTGGWARAPMVGITFGGALGLLAGCFRRRFETFVVGCMDVLLAFPPLILCSP